MNHHPKEKEEQPMTCRDSRTKSAPAVTLICLFVSIPMADRRQSARPGCEACRRETRTLLPLRRR